MNKRLIIGVASALSFVALAPAARADGSRSPIGDTFVNFNDRGKAFGDNSGIVVGNGREACFLFDVTGLANVEEARIRLYITQCGTTAGVVWPIYARIMRNDRWNETSLTWNSLPEEFRVSPSPVLATNDISLAGYAEIPAGSQDSWFAMDITEAVRNAAARGRIALHLYTTWDGTSGDNTPLSFASSNNGDATIHPFLEFAGTADSSASSLTLLPAADTFVRSGSSAATTQNGDLVLVDNAQREGFLKFDLTGIGVSSVDSAVLQVRTYSSPGQPNHTSDSALQFQLMGDNSWTEAGLTWDTASSYGATPGTAWTTEAPANALRAAGAETNRFHSIELAPLVNQVLASGGTTMSLHITMPDTPQRFFIFYSREYADEAWRPRLLVTPRADAALATRAPLQETFLSDYRDANKDLSFYNGDYASHVQIGCSGNKVQFATMLFDPTGLENADFVRFRVKSRNTISGGPGALRVVAWTTDRWSETNLTWNTAGPWFPQPTSVANGTSLDGEVANVRLTQSKSGAYFEVDVTAAARTAASAGRMLTLGLFSNASWPEFYKGASDAPAVLVFPNPDATFGARVTAALDESGATPALRLSWSPIPSGQGDYMVERQIGEGSWKTVATGLSVATCLDATAEPGIAHTYRITGYNAADGSSATMEAIVTLDAKKAVFACADTYVQNGSKANATFGTAASLVHKYEYGENSGGVREALYRFNLSEMPERFLSATLKLYPAGNAEGVSAGAHFDLFVYPDFEWSDSAPPAWNDIFGNGWATPQAYRNHPDGRRPNETQLGTYSYDDSSDITADVPVCFDVADAIRTAKANGDSHITLHTSAYSAGRWNFGIISRERSQGVSCAPQIEFALKNWVANPFVIVVR